MVLKAQKFVFVLQFFLVAFHSLSASGGFSGGGVQQIPQGQNREKFHLGKSVYNQEIPLPTTVDKKLEDSQSERLEYLQGALPNADKKRVYLPDLAGKLTSEQLEALEYFVSVRFNVKLEKK